jgi:hypothetical protein
MCLRRMPGGTALGVSELAEDQYELKQEAPHLLK